MSQSSVSSQSMQVEAQKQRKGVSMHMGTDLSPYPSLMDAPFIPKAQFLFVRPIGQGSFGRVFKGILYDQDVAIKQLTVKNFVDELGESASKLGSSDLDGSTAVSNLEAVASGAFGKVLLALEREVGILRQLRHQKIVMFLGVCLDPPCIITEYCQQGSLYDLLSRARERPEAAKKLTWKMRIKLALDAASGMKYLHSSNPAVLHRDLKTPNLLVDEHWNCKVADFNTSRFIAPSYVSSSISANNPRWLAPEVLQGAAHTKASDVYPFGIVLWELLTWKTPWEAETRNNFQIVNMVLQHGSRPVLPEDPAEYPGDPCPFLDEYEDFLQQCWDTTPANRPSFEEIVQKLTEFKQTIEKNNPKKVQKSRPKTPDPPVSPRLESKITSPFSQASNRMESPTKSQLSDQLENSPFSGGPPIPSNTESQERQEENPHPKKPSTPTSGEQKVADDEGLPREEGSRSPFCPPSFGVWSSHADSSASPGPEPTRAKEHWTNLKAIFLKSSKPPTGVVSEKWDMLRNLMFEGMVPELHEVVDTEKQQPAKKDTNLVDKSNQQHGLHRKGSKWDVVRDVFSCGSMEKNEEHPGWTLIKSILLPDKEDEKAESSGEPLPDEENVASSTARGEFKSKWEVLRHILFAEEVPRSPGWDLVHEIVTLRPSEDTPKISVGDPLESGSDTPMTPAKQRWNHLKWLFRDTSTEEKSKIQMHPGWQLVKQLLGDELDSASESGWSSSSKASEAQPNVGRGNRLLTRIPSKAERYWHFLRHMLVKDEASLLVKHWDFLQDTFGEMKDEEGERSQAPAAKGEKSAKSKVLKSPASKRWKKVRDLLIVDFNPPSKEKWNFLREWLTVDGDLGESWDELRAFARDRVDAPQGEDWDFFRTLFFEDRGVRTHPHWAFLKDLLVKDAVPASAMLETQDGRKNTVKPSKVREFVLEKRSTPPSKSRWSIVRTLFMAQESSSNGVRETILDVVEPPGESKWDEIISLLTSSQSIEM